MFGRYFLIFALVLHIVNYAFASAVTTTEGAQTVNKIAVVDVESVLEHSFAIKSIKKSISDISSKIERELTEKEISLKKIESDIIKDKDKISQEQFNAKVQDFNKIVNKAQMEIQTKKDGLEKAHSEAINKVQNSIISIISDLSKKNGYSMVVPSSQVLYVVTDLNITLEVITKLNEVLPAVEVNY